MVKKEIFNRPETLTEQWLSDAGGLHKETGWE